MSDKPPPRYATSPPRPSGPPIPRDEPDEASPLRRAVRKTPAVELPSPMPARATNATRETPAGDPRTEPPPPPPQRKVPATARPRQRVDDLHR